MPFKSRAQERAAFATGGFGGAINPKEWARKTNQKKLPERAGKKKKNRQSEAVGKYISEH